VNSPSLQTQLYGTTLTANQFTTAGGVSTVTTALANRVLGSGLNSQPAQATVTGELTSLIGKLCTTNSCSTLPGTYAVAAAACATALGSADMLIY
jgi:hypothetical protein